MNGAEIFAKHDFSVSKIILCAKVTRGTRVHRNRQSHGLVYYPDGGTKFVFSDGRELCMSRDTVIYLPKGSDYNALPEGDKTEPNCYAVNFLLNEELDCPPFVIALKGRGVVRENFFLAEKAFNRAEQGCLAECKSHLYAVISAIQKELDLDYANSSDIAKILPAVREIHNTYLSSPPTVASLAKLCDMSPEYMRSVFKRAYGASPLKYINGLRFGRAYELLSSGMYTVTQAAEASGFTDLSYFSREFKRRFGVSASEVGKN